MKPVLKSSFQPSVVKPKPQLSLRLITTDADSPMNQSKLEAITCSRRQARENARRQVTIGFRVVRIG